MIRQLIARIQANQNYLDILKGGGIAFALRIFAAIVSLALTVLVVKSVGVEQSGYYFFIISCLLLTSSISTFGLTNGVLKLASIKSNEGYSLLKLMTKSSFIIVLGWLVVSILFRGYDVLGERVGFEHFIIDSYLSVVVAALLPFSFLLVFSSLFQALRYIVISMVLLNLGYQGLLLLFIYVANISSVDGLFHALIWSLYAMLGFSVVLFIFLEKGKETPIDSVSLKSLISLSLPMMIAQILSQVSNFAAQFLLSLNGTAEEISFLAVSLRVALLMSFIVVAVNRISAPKFALLYASGDIEELGRVVRFSNRLLFLFCLPVLLFVVLFGREILGYFGDEFVAAYSLLVLLTLGQFIAATSGTVVFLLQMTGLEREFRNNIAIASILSVAIGCWLIPEYGLIGAGVMTFVSLVSANLLSCYRAYKVLGINPLKIL